MVITSYQISQRQKQVDLARSTAEYGRYVRCVKKENRRKEWRHSWHPETPDPNGEYSTRAFVGLIRKWRNCLHLWGNLDPYVYEYLCRSNPMAYPPSVEKKLSEIVDSENPSFQQQHRQQYGHQYGHQYSNQCNDRYISQSQRSKSTSTANGYPEYPAGHNFSSNNQTNSILEKCDRSTEPLSTIIQRKNNFLINVPPIYEGSEWLVLIKSDQIVEAAKDSSLISKALARQVVRGHSILMESDMVPQEELGHRILGHGDQPNLPVAFLPVEFRGMQKWPKCHFLKEEDLHQSIRDSEHHLSTVQKCLGHIPQILGTSSMIQHVRSVVSNEITSEIANRSSVVDSLQHRCLTDSARLAAFQSMRQKTGSPRTIIEVPSFEIETSETPPMKERFSGSIRGKNILQLQSRILRF